jgi:hypothetical protein
MQTITVELMNNHALKLLKDLEQAQIIRLVKNTQKPKDKKLSEQLWGTITPLRVNEIQTKIDEIRNEWERNI